MHRKQTKLSQIPSWGGFSAGLVNRRPVLDFDAASEEKEGNVDEKVFSLLIFAILEV